MSDTYRLQEHLKRINKAFRDNPANAQQIIFALGELLLQQDNRLSAIANVLGADSMCGDTDVSVELLAMHLAGHNDLCSIKFTAADWNRKHGFDGCPVDLRSITGDQCTDIFNLLKIKPFSRGTDYAEWQIFEVGADPTQEGEESVYASADDIILIDRRSGNAMLMHHHTNDPAVQEAGIGVYVFSVDTFAGLYAILK